ncbi:MAG TPA: LacI family DNA-binding transcriptional regulator [Bacteroidales bacterium]|nr:LacI family DNA-binding transcriptional regulator [Bacteroidales bacterium]
MAKKIKVKDIAARVGLSSTLVSLVLNNKADQHGIKRQTQEKVLETAVRMGYFKQSGEPPDQKTDNNKTGLIGMVVPNINDPFTINITPYLSKALGSIGVGLATIALNPNEKKFEKLVMGLRKLFTGLILTGDAADESTIRSLRNANYPFIILEKSIRSIRMNLVRSDCEAGAKMLCDHISKLGYKNFTIISSDRSQSIVRENISCFTEILREVCDSSEINEAILPKRAGSSYIYTDELGPYLRPPISTELLIVSEANLMMPVIKTLEHGKIRVPGDVAIVALEDSPDFDMLHTTITRLRRKLPEIATKTARMIWTEVKNSGRSKFKRTVTITPELVVGKSCGTI